MIEVCYECCQHMSENINCYCQGGDISTKHIGAVDGCVIFDKHVRCKRKVYENLVCISHNKKNFNSFGMDLDKYF